VKIVVALTQPPLPEGGAAGRCALGLLRGLREHGLDVHPIAARQWFALPGEPPADLGVEVVPVAREPRLRAHLHRWRRPRGELGRGAFAARIREAALDADVLHLEEVETTWAAEGVEVRSVLHMHYLVRRDRTLGPPWSEQFRVVLEFALAERAARRRHRYLVASSPLVAAELRAAAGTAEVVLAPLSLDPRHYAPAPLDGPPTAGLIGTAAWPPTEQAVRRLVRRIWPLVRRRVPEARLVVAGRGTASLSGPASAPGIDFVGEVPSAPGFFSGLSLLLFPLERGSGMKVKVLESIASGLPVVTTPAGAEGIDAGDGIAVESEDERLAAAAAQILSDDYERRERGAAARAAFERRYSPRPATEPLVGLYERMAAAR
jgi:glycosyltransferase involved in cell wall biosynthesis